MNTKSAVMISWVSIIVNLLLSILKLIVGFLGHSKALVADAVHSASDVFSTIIVLIGISVSKRPADRSHEYGHEKFEDIATLFLSFLLIITGLQIGKTGVTALLSIKSSTPVIPSVTTIAIAALSIFVKELMFQVTFRIGKREKSSALIADAWHHRSDALSSVGSLLGILFARHGFPFFDALASIVITAFILKTAVDIMLPAIKGLTDYSCSDTDEARIRELALATDGVCGIDLLKTRKHGNGYYVDMEIRVCSTLRISEAHAIAEQVHDALEAAIPEIRHCMVHVNPAE